MLLRYYQADGFTNRDALAVYDLLRSKPEIQEIDEPAGTFYLWQRLADRIFAAPKVWMDAYLASFAICGELKLVTLDRDFQNYQDQGLQLQLLAVPSGDSP